MIEWFLALPWFGQLAAVLVAVISIPILLQVLIFLVVTAVSLFCFIMALLTGQVK